MNPLLLTLLLAATPGSDDVSPPARSEPPVVVVAVGAPGANAFGEKFEAAARSWETASRAAGAACTVIGLEPDSTNDLDRLKAVLLAHPRQTTRELWLVLIGHGTFDGKEAKFNLRGPDLSASELAAWVGDFQGPLAIINTSSSSGPFLKKLSAPGRVIVTATRSGYELSFTRFGEYFSSAIANPQGDLDKDGQVSLLEAFLMASHQVAEFYKTEGRLASEHALLDDNGDGLGTAPDWFHGIRAVKKAADGASLDGSRAHQMHLLPSDTERRLSPQLRARRNELELRVEEMRQQKAQLSIEEYYQKLEPILLELARLYESSEASSPPADSAAAAE
jgi:hypothetical protein